jgi:hypothetical protein
MFTLGLHCTDSDCTVQSESVQCNGWDVEIDAPSMSRWTREEARRYFASGGSERPETRQARICRCANLGCNQTTRVAKPPAVVMFRLATMRAHTGKTRIRTEVLVLVRSLERVGRVLFHRRDLSELRAELSALPARIGLEQELSDAAVKLLRVGAWFGAPPAVDLCLRWLHAGWEAPEPAALTSTSLVVWAAAESGRHRAPFDLQAIWIVVLEAMGENPLRAGAGEIVDNTRVLDMGGRTLT